MAPRGPWLELLKHLWLLSLPGLFPSGLGHPRVLMPLQACRGQKAETVGCGQWAWRGVLREGTGTPPLNPQVLGHQAGLSGGSGGWGLSMECWEPTGNHKEAGGLQVIKSVKAASFRWRDGAVHSL